MKYLVLIIITLTICISCDQPSEFVRDNPRDPEGPYFGIKMSVPQKDNYLSDTLSIIVTAQYPSTQYNLDRVELYLNDSLLTSTNILPTTYILNAEHLEYNSHIIKCSAYDKNGTVETINDTIITMSRNLYLNDIVRNSESVNIQWEFEPDKYFSHFDIYFSEKSDMANPILISQISDPNKTSFMDKYRVSEESFYQIKVVNNLGYIFNSNIKSIHGRLVNIAHLSGLYVNTVNMYDNTIFVGSGKKLYAYSFVDNILNQIDVVSLHYDVSKIEFDIDGTILVANDYLDILSFDGSKFNRIASIGENKDIIDLAIYKQTGTIFGAIENWGGLGKYIFDGSDIKNTAYHYIYGYTKAIAIDANNIIFVGHSGGLSAYTMSFINICNEENVVPQGITISSDNKLYTASNNGLSVYTYKNSSFTKISNIYNGGYGIEVVIDSSGVVFLANSNDGLRAYEFDGLKFTNLAHSYYGGNAVGVAIGPDNTILLANYNDGLRVYKYAP